MFCQPKKYYEYYKCPVIRTCPPRKPKIIIGPTGGGPVISSIIPSFPSISPSIPPVGPIIPIIPVIPPVGPVIPPVIPPVGPVIPVIPPITGNFSSPTPGPYTPTPDPYTPGIETTIKIPRGNNGYDISRTTINENIPLVSFVFTLTNNDTDKENKINFLKNNKLSEISFDIDQYQTPNTVSYDFYYQEGKDKVPLKLGSVVLNKVNSSYPEKVTLSNLNLQITPSIGDYLDWYPIIYISSPNATGISMNASQPYYNYPDNYAGVKGRCILYTSGNKDCKAIQATGILKFKGSGPYKPTIRPTPTIGPTPIFSPTCGPLMSNNNQSSQCKCIKGYYLNGSTCTPCEPGYYCDNNVREKCGFGYYCRGFVNGNVEKILCSSSGITKRDTAQAESECLVCGSGSQDNPIGSVSNIGRSNCICENDARKLYIEGNTTKYGCVSTNIGGRVVRM